MKIKEWIFGRDTGYPPPENFLYFFYPLFQFLTNLLYQNMAVFGALLYDQLPMQGTEEMLRTPRATIGVKYFKHIPIYEVSFLKATANVLPEKRLHAEALLLRDIIGNTTKDKAFMPTDQEPVYNGLPRLYLLDIQDRGTHLAFRFVWVCCDAAAEFAHQYGRVDGDGSNTKDTDF